MGKYVHLTGSSASNLYAIEGTPVIKSTIGKLCLMPSYPHTHELLEHTYNGLAMKAFQVYNYGRDHYTLGLPDGYGVYLDTTPLQDVQDAVEDSVGYAVDIHDNTLNTPQALIISHWYAKTNWGWDEINNTFSSPPISPESGYALSIHEAEFDGEGVLRVNFYRGEEYAGPGATKSVYGIVRVRDHGFDLDTLYYHVSHTPQGSAGVNKSYWFYSKGTGTYPDLEGNPDIQYGSPFMPVVPLRVDNESLGPECLDGEFVRDVDENKIKPDTDLYRTSVKLCKKMGTDFDELTRELSSNSDVDQVDNTFIIFGIDIRTETKSGKHYLFQFFEDMALSTVGASSIEVKDSSYRIKLEFSDITRTVHTGILDEDTVLTFSGDDLTISHRISDTQYITVFVEDLTHINYIQGRHDLVTSLKDSASEDNANFIIPLRYSLIALDRSMFERENLMRESLKIVFNSYERQKLKWYQTDLFKFVMMVVAIVVTAFSLGTLGAAMSAAVSALDALLIAAEAALYAQLISLAFRILAKYIPTEILAIVAVVVLAVAGTQALGGVDITSMTAETFMSLSTNLMDATQASIGYEVEDLMDEMSDFQEEAQALEDELTLMEEELAGNPLFDVHDVLVRTPMFIEGEVPTDFYTRTIHMGNIGVQSLNVIESYVDTQLKLPEKI